jgi:hypothetical protein
MIFGLIWLIGGVAVLLVLVSRRLASVQERVETAITVLAAWTLITTGSAARVLDPVVIPATNYLSRHLTPRRALDRMLEFFGYRFGDALAAGDTGPVAQATMTAGMKSLFETDFPSDLLPGNAVASDLIDRLLPARVALSAVTSADWDAAVEFALRTFAFVACISALCAAGTLLADSLQWFLRVAFGGFFIASGASLLTLASAVRGFRMAGARASLESKAGDARSWMAELQTASGFLLPARGWQVEAGMAIGKLRALGIAGAQHTGRPIVFDDSSMIRGLGVSAKHSEDDAIRLTARIAKSWLSQHKAGLIAVDLTGLAGSHLAAAARSVRSTGQVHEIGTGMTGAGIDVGREIDGEALEAACLSLLKPNAAASVIAASTVRRLRSAGPVYRDARRLSLAASGPQADPQSLLWALETVIRDGVEDVVGRIETVQRADLEKIEFEADPKQLEERRLLYASHFGPEIQDAIAGLRREWLAADKSRRAKASAALKAAFDTILSGKLWRSGLLRENPLALPAAAKGNVFVFSTPGQTGAAAAALTFAAIGSLYRSLGEADEVPLFLAIGLDGIQIGQRIVLDLLDLLQADMVPRMLVLCSGRERGVASRILQSTRSHINFRTSDTETLEAAFSGLRAWRGPVAPAVSGNVEVPSVRQNAEALGFHLLRQNAFVPSGVHAMPDDPADSHCATAALGPEIASSLAGILDDLPPGAAMLQWIRCGVRRSAIARLVLEPDN